MEDYGSPKQPCPWLWKTEALSDLEELVLVVSRHGVHQLLHLVNLLTTPVSAGLKKTNVSHTLLKKQWHVVYYLFIIDSYIE